MTINSDRRTGEPRLASVASWAVLAASFGLSASTWIALGVLAGFTSTVTIKGITLFRLAWLMPIAVDGYVVVALVLWMAPVPARVASFAKKNTYLAASTGIVAQSAYHLLFTMSTTNQWWRVILAALVGALPPTVAGLAVHMRALIRRESGTHNNTINPQPSTVDTTAVPATVTVPVPVAPSTMDTPTQPTTEPVRPAPAPVPTPAQVAARITPPRPAPVTPAAVPDQPAPTTRPRTNGAPAPASKLAPPATDHNVTAQGAAQLALPIADPQPLDRAREVARQYQAEHGTRINPGQLAARLKVNSDQAAHLLDLLNTEPANSTVPTVNGRRLEATTR